VLKENGRTGKKEGRITEVTHRKQNEFIGHLQVSPNFAFLFLTHDKPMPISIFP
jgi:ribonuclease R